MRQNLKAGELTIKKSSNAAAVYVKVRCYNRKQTAVFRKTVSEYQLFMLAKQLLVVVRTE